MKYDFLVVGGGIGGTVLAGILGRRGEKVIVIEKSTAPLPWVRPEILWPATLEILFSLVPKEKLLEKGVLPVNGLQVKIGGTPKVRVTAETFRELQIQPWSANPNQTREELLTLDSFELKRGFEVRQILKDQDRIVGVKAGRVGWDEETEILADWTIGDDGGNSVVRKAAGIEMPSKLFPLNFLCFGFEWSAKLEPGTFQVWVNLSGQAQEILALLAVPNPNNQGAGAILVRPSIFENQYPLEENWMKFCSQDDLIREVTGNRKFPQDFVRVERWWGHAPRYGVKGAILIGDAAHPVSPVGGQGANMSVADAWAVADIVLNNPQNLLAEYERRRRPANQRSLRFTKVADRLLRSPQFLLNFGLKSFFNLTGNNPSWMKRVIRNVSTAFLEK